MKSTGKCPKCGSEKVFSGASLPIWTKQGSYYANAIPITGWRYAELDNYVCANCGYVESYIGNAGKRNLISQKWPKVLERTFEAIGQVHSGEKVTCPGCDNLLEKGWKACPYCGQQMD